MEIVLMDTDFVYEYFSQNPEAVKVTNDIFESVFIIGFTTAAELVKTAYNKEKLNKLNTALRRSKLEILHIDKDISEKALKLIRQYHLSHAASIADMLLAAAATNDAHFNEVKKIPFLL